MAMMMCRIRLTSNDRLSSGPSEVLLVIDGIDEAEAAHGLPHGNRWGSSRQGGEGGEHCTLLLSMHV